VPKRGEFGAEWWARRWLEVLESLGWASRLQRGRAYARGGRVLEIKVEPGGVTARVQGSRPRPYTVKISVRPLSDEQWERVLDAIAARASFLMFVLRGRTREQVLAGLRERRMERARAELGAAEEVAERGARLRLRVPGLCRPGSTSLTSSARLRAWRVAPSTCGLPRCPGLF
jgi:uncharacterized Zn finger protein